jgi:hypothetical protein
MSISASLEIFGIIYGLLSAEIPKLSLVGVLPFSRNDK